MNPSIRARRLAFLVLAVLLAAVPLTAQTILLAIQETANGTPLAPPLPAREGVAGSLFDNGFIVLDLPGDAPSATAELIRVARAAGADLVLEVRVQYSDRSLGVGKTRISGSVAYTLTDTTSGAVRAKGQEGASNADREKDVDRVILGQEIGKTLVLRIQQALKSVPR